MTGSARSAERKVSTAARLPPVVAMEEGRRNGSFKEKPKVRIFMQASLNLKHWQLNNTVTYFLFISFKRLC